jgi:hypothetical protein
MNLSRRGLLIGGGLLVAAPTIVRAASLMPIRGERLIVNDPPSLILPHNGRYILQGTKPVPCPDLLTWGRWLERFERHVGETFLSDGTRVSTVFLGLDHSFSRYEDGPHEPVLFETMVFGGPNNEEMYRYSTWEEAEVGHREMVAREQRRSITLIKKEDKP